MREIDYDSRWIEVRHNPPGIGDQKNAHSKIGLTKVERISAKSNTCLPLYFNIVTRINHQQLTRYSSSIEFFLHLHISNFLWQLHCFFSFKSLSLSQINSIFPNNLQQIYVTFFLHLLIKGNSHYISSKFFSTSSCRGLLY